MNNDKLRERLKEGFVKEDICDNIVYLPNLCAEAVIFYTEDYKPVYDIDILRNVLLECHYIDSIDVSPEKVKEIIASVCGQDILDKVILFVAEPSSFDEHGGVLAHYIGRTVDGKPVYDKYAFDAKDSVGCRYKDPGFEDAFNSMLVSKGHTDCVFVGHSA